MNNSSVSTESLKSLSMELGASLELPGGKVFNSAGSKGAFTIRPPVKPVEPPPQPEWMQQLLTQMLASQSQVMERIHQTAVKSGAVSWSFNFVRNPDGTIKSITAVPQE